MQAVARDSTHLHRGPPAVAVAEMAVSKVGGRVMYRQAMHGSASDKNVGRLYNW